MTTLRQTAANRRNATLSTGPTSDEGKAISRANALKHGLSGAGIVLPDEEVAAVEERIQQWDSSFHPFEQADVWLVSVAATESVRVDRCRLHEADLRERQVRRADLLWDDDRRLAAEVLAAGLARRPEIVARQLRQTSQGADVLIERWRALGHALDRDGAWDDARRASALDLLGVPHDHRDGPTRLDPPDGSPALEWLRETVHAEVAGLAARKPALDDLDGREQAAAMLGLEPTPDTELKRLRRYEAACMRRFQWAYAKLTSRRRHDRPARPDPDRRPAPPAESAPAHVAPAPAPAPAHVAPAPPADPEAAMDRLREEAIEVLMDPDNHDPRPFYEYCRLSELPGSNLPMLPLLGRPAAPPAAAPPPPADAPRPAPPALGNRRARRAAKWKTRRH